MIRYIMVLVMSILTFSVCMLKAQQPIIANPTNSVILPDDYQGNPGSFPLMVCFRHETTDSLLKTFANTTQRVILQFAGLPDSAVTLPSIQEIILKTIYTYRIIKNKIYLLGVNEQIGKTLLLYKAMDDYFAATAFITTDITQYNLLKDQLKITNSSKLFLADALTLVALEPADQLFLSHYLWSFDVQKMSEDAIQFQMVENTEEKYRWTLSLKYGQWNFAKSAKAKEVSLLEFPKNMSVWNLSFAKPLSEHISLHAGLELLLRKNAPPSPDIFSILGGADVEIDGGGLFLLPISVGMDYLFMKNRFRPYAGLALGMVPAQYKYVEVRGNISDGINRKDNGSKSSAPFIELSSGFVYRSGKRVQMGLNVDYTQSKEFDKNMGGYKAYNGFKISAGISVFFR